MTRSQSKSEFPYNTIQNKLLSLQDEFTDLCNHMEITKQVIQNYCGGNKNRTLNKLSLKEGEQILNPYLEQEIT